MYKLLRYYNQNRKKVWTTIIVIIFIIIMIQLFNEFAIENKKEKLEKSKNEENQINQSSYASNSSKNYEEESESIISSGDVPSKYKTDFGELIDEFYTYCIKHEPQKAYEMLSSDTKSLMYPTEELFENLYYKSKFEGDQQYSFQSWSTSGNIYVYLVKIYDNMLTTGKKNDEYIEDYVTITAEGDTYKLNINKYIKTRKISKSNSNEQLSVKVVSADVYLDYEIYTITIKNNTDSKLLLDTRKKSKTLYITENNGNRYDSYLYENKDTDLILEPYESKTIKIKFNDKYSPNIWIKSITFSDIVDYDEYLEDKDVERKEIKVEL